MLQAINLLILIYFEKFSGRNYTEKLLKPHHNRLGYFIASDGSSKDICDCQDKECLGCHWPCRKCGSQKCSFRCRIGRNLVIEYVEHCGIDKKEPNPYLTKDDH